MSTERELEKTIYKKLSVAFDEWLKDDFTHWTCEVDAAYQGFIAAFERFSQPAGTVAVPVELLEETLEWMGRDCYFDHHGYCQAHGLQARNDCFAGKLRKLLEGECK